MSSLKPTTFQVKVNELSEAEAEDGELGVCIDIEPTTLDTTNLSSTTANMDTMEMEVDTGDDYVNGSNDAAAASVDKSFFSGFKSTSSSFFLNKKTAATTFVATMLLGTVAVVGIYMSSINDHKNVQQQEALSAITGHQGKGHGRSHSSSRSKSGKSTTTTASVCLSDHDPIDDEGLDECKPKVVECGDTFTNEEIVLTHDLFCANDYWKLTDEEKQQLMNRGVNGAITLSGPSASIDCKGYSIRQIYTAPTWPPATCWMSILGQGLDDPFERRLVCSNYYHAGILLVDGAKAINCKADNFYDGFFIINGGEIRKSEASGNTNGIAVQDVSGSIETKVSDVYTHDNFFYGIEVRNVASSNVVTIEEVTSMHDGGGMHLFGPNITVKDSTTSYNRMDGIFVGSNDLYFFEPQGLYTTKVQFEGKVSSHNNRGYGIVFRSYGGWFDESPLYAEFTVKGDVSLYLNGGGGLSIESTPHHDILFTVEESGSLNSCHNGGIDILNSMNEVSFLDEGVDGYSCETTLESYGGQGLPVCASCPDTCN